MVDLSPRAIAIEDANGMPHQMTATGQFTFLTSGRCLVVVNVHIDGKVSTGKHGCSYRIEGDRLTLGEEAGLDQGARNVFRVSQESERLVLEEIYEEAQSVKFDRSGHERVVLQRRTD